MLDARRLTTLLEYTEWADGLLYGALAALPAESSVAAPRPGRPQGMLGVLGHMLVVDLIWKGHLEGRDHGFKARTLEKLPPLAELRAAQVESDRWYVDFARLQPETGLDERIHFRFVDGGPGVMSRGDMLMHIVNHKTYHRGYVADMLYELGSQPPTMDLPVYLRDVSPRSGG